MRFKLIQLNSIHALVPGDSWRFFLSYQSSIGVCNDWIVLISIRKSAFRSEGITNRFQLLTTRFNMNEHPGCDLKQTWHPFRLYRVKKKGKKQAGWNVKTIGSWIGENRICWLPQTPAPTRLEFQSHWKRLDAPGRHRGFSSSSGRLVEEFTRSIHWT